MTLNVSPRIIELLTSRDTDGTIVRQLTPGRIPAAAAAADWRPGQALSLLLVGAVGIGNVGADMRSGEIVRQLRLLLGAEQVRLSVLASGEHWPAPLMPGVEWRGMGFDFAETLAHGIASHHGVVACEGSMFKSTFSNALSAMMAGALGHAAAGGKLAVGYGAEIGSMEPPLEALVAGHLNGALILCRNPESRRIADRLGLRAADGADTAWTFEAASPARAAELLRQRGWNGHAPLLTVCPNNPFWWPIRPDPRLAQRMRQTGAGKDLFYGLGFMFHTRTAESERKYQRYLDQLALAVRHLAREGEMFPILIGMDRADETACGDLSARLGGGIVTFLGYRHAAADVIAILRRSRLLLSARFHALVGAMPAAVASLGIAMDERVRNLLRDDDGARVVSADDPELGSRLIEAAHRLDPGRVRACARATVGSAVEGMGQMGMAFVDEVSRVLPDFPLRDRGRGWQAHLPPLPRAVAELLS
jgi:polysaccharide pyruvyl transferase WcaK-like protein